MPRAEAVITHTGHSGVLVAGCDTGLTPYHFYVTYRTGSSRAAVSGVCAGERCSGRAENPARRLSLSHALVRGVKQAVSSDIASAAAEDWVRSRVSPHVSRSIKVLRRAYRALRARRAQHRVCRARAPPDSRIPPSKARLPLPPPPLPPPPPPPPPRRSCGSCCAGCCSGRGTCSRARRPWPARCPWCAAIS